MLQTTISRPLGTQIIQWAQELDWRLETALISRIHTPRELAPSLTIHQLHHYCRDLGFLQHSVSQLNNPSEPYNSGPIPAKTACINRTSNRGSGLWFVFQLAFLMLGSDLCSEREQCVGQQRHLRVYTHPGFLLG